MRRFIHAACGVLALLALTPSHLASAGNGTGGPVFGGEVNGECAVLPSTVNATTPTTVLSGTWAWNFNLSTLPPVGQGSNGTITVNSGYPATTLLAESHKGPFPCVPGTPLSAGSGLPYTVTGTCDGQGGCASINLGSDIPAQQAAGYSLVRSASPMKIAHGGSTQTVVVGLDQGLNCTAVSVISNVPGAVVTSATAVGGSNGQVNYGGPEADLDFGCNYSGQPVAFVVTFDVPNPFKKPFVSMPEVQLFNGASDNLAPSCSGFAQGTTHDPGPTGSETVSDSTLDGGAPGAGTVTYSLNGYSGSWDTSQGCATFVDYQATPLP